jgi:hypothetical protein
MFLRRMGATWFLFSAPSISADDAEPDRQWGARYGPRGGEQPGADGKKITNEDWDSLAGVTATIQRLAFRDGGLSVQNLDPIYFRKPLHGLAKYDLSLPKTLKLFAKTRRRRLA